MDEDIGIRLVDIQDHYTDLRLGKNGLRNKIQAFQQPHYLQTYIQSVLNAVGKDKYYSKDLQIQRNQSSFNHSAIQVIIQVAIANGVRGVRVSSNRPIRDDMSDSTTVDMAATVCQDRNSIIGKQDDDIFGTFILSTNGVEVRGLNQDINSSNSKQAYFGIKFGQSHSSQLKDRQLRDTINTEIQNIQSYLTLEDCPNIPTDKTCSISLPGVAGSKQHHVVKVEDDYEDDAQRLTPPKNNLNSFTNVDQSTSEDNSQQKVQFGSNLRRRERTLRQQSPLVRPRRYSLPAVINIKLQDVVNMEPFKLRRKYSTEREPKHQPTRQNLNKDVEARSSSQRSLHGPATRIKKMGDSDIINNFRSKYANQLDTGVQQALTNDEMAEVLREFDQIRAEKASLSQKLKELQRENQRLREEKKIQSCINQVEIKSQSSNQATKTELNQISDQVIPQKPKTRLSSVSIITRGGKTNKAYFPEYQSDDGKQDLLFPDPVKKNTMSEEDKQAQITVSTMLLKFLKETSQVDSQKGKQVLDKMVYSLIKGYKDFNMRQALIHQEKLSSQELNHDLREVMADEKSLDRSPKTAKKKQQQMDQQKCAHLTQTAGDIYRLLFDNLDKDCSKKHYKNAQKVDELAKEFFKYIFDAD